MKNLLKLSDLSKDEILDIIDLGKKLKHDNKNGIKHNDLLQGKSLGMIFTKSSTRTRVSFEVGIYQLGGQGLFLSQNDLQLGRGEPICDTAAVLSRYLDGIMIRTYAQQDVEDLAKYGSIPVINGLTDYAHPCQVLADFMTISEYKGKLEGLKLCFIGDVINMANSLVVGGLTVGMNVSVAAPERYNFDPSIINFAKPYGKAFTFTNNVMEAAADADILITDVWASMGQESETEKRKRDFAGYCINSEVMSAAKKDAIVQHCLPAHRGEEITAEVFDAHQNVIYDEAENRLHVQKAVMVKLMK